MSSSIRSVLAQNGNRVRLLESHDGISREIIRNGEGDDGEQFHGIWMSGLTQTTYLGVPDTELISPLERASMMAETDYISPTGTRPMCAVYDADGGGNREDIPELVMCLARQDVSMVVIEDKYVGKPGAKVNSLGDTSGSQKQEDPSEFAKTVQAFAKASAGVDMMITARIETFTVRKVLDDEAQEVASAAAALEEALYRAKIYVDAGADAIMIHSKSSSPEEVLSFIARFRAMDSKTTLVVVPTTYAQATEDELRDAGANVIIYANHLMRAKIKAITEFSKQFLLETRSKPVKDKEFLACAETKNFAYLLQRLMRRDTPEKVLQWYRILGEAYAVENMARVVKCLLNGKNCGAADPYIIPVKELLKINSYQLAEL
jgi:phosphoenolpyruvate phosphomutase